MLGETPPDEWESITQSAFEIGARCIRLAGDYRDTDAVQLQLAAAVSDVEKVLTSIPELVERRLMERIGTADGQVLAPVRALVNEATAVSGARINEIRALLTDDLDPGRDTSKLGSALKGVSDLLDPRHKNSVQANIDMAVRDICAADGRLTKVVRTVVSEVVTPLSTEIDRLRGEFVGKQAANEIIQQTTAKGKPYEDEVLRRLQRWGALVGAEIHHVGVDNRPGDILVVIPTVAGEVVSIVVEARDRSSGIGRKAVAAALAKAIEHRDAHAAVYVSATPRGLAHEVGDWAEGETTGGPYAAVCDEHLITALRFVAAQVQLVRARRSRARIDRPAIERQLDRIRTALGRITTIHRKLGAIRDTTIAVQQCADSIREDIRDSLVAIEDGLQRPRRGDDPH
jgi:hypothetical protein